MVEMEQ